MKHVQNETQYPDTTDWSMDKKTKYWEWRSQFKEGPPYRFPYSETDLRQVGLIGLYKPEEGKYEN